MDCIPPRKSRFCLKLLHSSVNRRWFENADRSLVVGEAERLIPVVMTTISFPFVPCLMLKNHYTHRLGGREMKAFGLCFLGVVIIAGAVAAWHYWEIHGFLAFMAAGFGADVVWEGLKATEGKKKK